MKITDLTVTLFAWPGIPDTTYGRHTGHFSGESQLGLVTLRTDGGVEGHAFLGSAMRGAHFDAQGLIHYLKPLVMGQDPLDRERLWQSMWSKNRNTTLRAIGAVDVALWDLGGKIANLPIHRLLGSYRTSVPAYASSAVLASPAAYAEEAARYKAAGWRAYKIHPPTNPALDIEVCRAVRSAVGNHYTVMLDSTWAYEYPDALRVGKVAEELGFYWYEDPLADDDIYNYVKLKQQLSIPILATEYAPGGFTALAPWVVARATDYLRGDPAVKGGNYAAHEVGAPRGSFPHGLRGPPRWQLAEQRGQYSRDHGHQELRILRGPAPGGGPEVRAGRGHRARRPGPGPRLRETGPRGHHRL